MPIQNRIQSVYDRIAGSDQYKKADGRLKIISWAVVTISAVSTAYVNGFSHVKVIGYFWACVLALLTFAIVEGTLFTVEDGLRDAFKGGTQRMLAWICKWVIKGTMILNAAYLCAIIAGIEAPGWLLAWNHWAFAVHFAVGLVLVSMIRDSDPVIANRMLRLRAEMAHEDQIITRMVAAMASPFGMVGAGLRGMCDSCKTGWKLFRNKKGFDADRYVENMNRLADEQFGFIHGREREPQQLPGHSAPQLPGQQPIQLPAAQPSRPQLPPLPTPPVLPAPSRIQAGSNGQGNNGSNGHHTNP